MVALVLLALIGTALVVVRVVLNGTREASAAPTQPSGIPEAEATPAVRRRRAPVKPAVGNVPSSPSGRWPGGPCPACGSQVSAGAKFCGECGNRLAT